MTIPFKYFQDLALQTRSPVATQIPIPCTNFLDHMHDAFGALADEAVAADIANTAAAHSFGPLDLNGTINFTFSWISNGSVTFSVLLENNSPSPPTDADTNTSAIRKNDHLRFTIGNILFPYYIFYDSLPNIPDTLRIPAAITNTVFERGMALNIETPRLNLSIKISLKLDTLSPLPAKHQIDDNATNHSVALHKPNRHITTLTNSNRQGDDAKRTAHAMAKYIYSQYTKKADRFSVAAHRSFMSDEDHITGIANYLQYLHDTLARFSHSAADSFAAHLHSQAAMFTEQAYENISGNRHTAGYRTLHLMFAPPEVLHAAGGHIIDCGGYLNAIHPALSNFMNFKLTVKGNYHFLCSQPVADTFCFLLLFAENSRYKDSCTYNSPPYGTTTFRYDKMMTIPFSWTR